MLIVMPTDMLVDSASGETAIFCELLVESVPPTTSWFRCGVVKDNGS